MTMTRSTVRQEYRKILLPAFSAVVLFLVMIFAVLLPAAQDQLLRQKKQMIVSMVDSAWSVLAAHEQRAAAGELSRRDAQALAAQQVRLLRYGPEQKDYFWINDLRPAMVMHPYRRDLDGSDLSVYVDRQGTPLFRNMVDTVRHQGAGFVEYLWQWKDEPAQIAPKLSYVRLFPAWGWIVGTGVYLDDITAERRSILREMAFLSLGILAAIIGVSAYLLHGSLQEVRRRLLAEEALAASQEQLRTLLQERTMKLQTAEQHVKTLHGLLPLCMSCKKIRDDKGYWNQLELYIRDHSEAEVSHALCPECAARIYPDHYHRLSPKQP